jgi:hypothetical protein
MVSSIKAWWIGAPIKHETLSGGAYSVDYVYKRHWTSIAAHAAVRFWLKHWQWCFGAIFAASGLVIAAMKL